MSDLANSTEALDYISIVWRDRVLVAISVVQHRLHFEVLSKLWGEGGVADPLHCTFIPTSDMPVFSRFFFVITNKIATLKSAN